jgi:hypothetical protein
MRQAAVRIDARGLVPLDEARAVLARTDTFGDDVVWAALLSLEDPAEAVTEARRLRWAAHPRRPDDIALLERYGDGIFPWLEDHVDASGNLVNVPWVVTPCIESLGSKRAFELVWRVRTIDGADDGGEAARSLFLRWVARHPHVGYPELARRAWFGDETARTVLRKSAPHPPEMVHRYVSATAGDAAANELFAILGMLATPPDGVRRHAIGAMTTELPERLPVEDLTASWSAPAADAAAFDGDWYCASMRWGVRIEGLAGRTFVSPGPHAPMGDVSLRILKSSRSGWEFLGEALLEDGRFHPVTAIRADALTLRMNGAGRTWDLTWRSATAPPPPQD